MIEAYLRVRVGSEDAHYGTIAAGAFVMQLFGDLATEITVRRDGDEGLLRAYESVEFLEPVRPGDFLECRARLVREGRTSRTFHAWASKVRDVLPSRTSRARHSRKSPGRTGSRNSTLSYARSSPSSPSRRTVISVARSPNSCITKAPSAIVP